MTETNRITDATLSILLDNQRAFLGYLARRTGSREVAEDVLQEGLAKVLARPDQAPSDESVVPWFYRVLRNAVIDRSRRQGTADRALEAFAHELQGQQLPDQELSDEICRCVTRLAATLKPEYAHALQAIDVSGESVKDYARLNGLTPGNAGVRVFRAREALKKRVAQSCGACSEHGCLNCTCRPKSSV